MKSPSGGNPLGWPFRVVPDTNVILPLALPGTEAGARANGLAESRPREFVRRALEGHFTLLMTISILLELAEQLDIHHAPRQLVHDLIEQLRLYAEEIRVPTYVVRYCTDPDDDKFVEAAEHGRATHLVSHDRSIWAFYNQNKSQLGWIAIHTYALLTRLREGRAARGLSPA